MTSLGQDLFCYASHIVKIHLCSYIRFSVPYAQFIVDIQHFLSYGHINIYTPTLFRFLLKSEGYEFISE